MKRFLSAVAVLCFVVPALFAQAPGGQSRVSGVFDAAKYNDWGASIVSGNSATGSQTITICPAIVSLRDGRQVNVLANPNGAFAPLLIDPQGSSVETVTPTAVSLVSPPASFSGNAQCANVTASFSNTHGASLSTFQVKSGTFGLQEAINDANANGGGTVVVDSQFGGSNATLLAAVPFANVAIEDTRFGPSQFWNSQGGLTTLALPTTLTGTTALPSATPVGAFGTGTYHMCIAYVDLAGQEGPCSADFSEAGLATGSFIFSAPAASPGAVGYTIYIGLTGGGVTNLDYKVPLTAQPTAVGLQPLSNGVCTLTKVETITPACAVTNATYNQVGATATVTAITVNTSPIQPQSTVISTTSIYVPNAGGRTTYTYTPGSRSGLPGSPGSFLPFPLTAAAATTVPAVLGTVNLPPGIMNYVGRTIEVCGYATATATAATIENIQMQWDAMGQNTAGKGVPISSMTATTTLASTGHISFCQNFQTTVASATATGGSINPGQGFINVAGVDLAATVAGGSNTLTGAVGSLNLADAARINVIWLHTTATDGAGLILQNLSFRVIN